MGFLKRMFGIEELTLSESDEKLINDQLRKVDETRLLFFSYVVVVALSVIVLLDFIYFDESLRVFYIFLDSLLWVVVFTVIVISHLDKYKKTKTIAFLKKTLYTVFPLFLLLWATAVCAIDLTSILNLITFYFVLFIIAFSVLTPLKTLLFYYIVITVEFVLLSLLVDHPILTENSFIMILVCVLTIPFYYSFRTTRVKAQAAINMLDRAKMNLQNEIDARTRELLHLNNSLKSEIAQRKIIESKLRETLKLAESNTQLKTEFLANISHEIRTPLNAIIGFTEMMFEDSVTPERKKEFQELVEINTGFLLSTIDDIFDVSLVKTEQINPVPKPFTVKRFLDNVFYELNSIAHKYQRLNLEIIKHHCPVEDMVIVTDEYLLKKAVLRLADNAYKFTEQGIIEIGISVYNERVDFFVSDTGIGIPEKDTIKIFEPFVQGDGSFTRDFGGSGLGLTITKGISNALGALLTFNSKIGTGSKFTISFDKSIIQN
jgi:signal transduction histidine kinase